jgi:hypothetical protein
LPRLETNASCARTRSSRPLCRSSRGPIAPIPTSCSAASNAPAWRLVRAAPRARCARRAGSCVSATARCRNAAAAARPPRAWARPAARSSSAATFSSGPSAASARCHARRSGSTCASVDSAKASWTCRRSDGDATLYTADRTSG